MTERRNWQNLGYMIAKVGERTGLQLSSGRVGYDAAMKQLLIVD